MIPIINIRFSELIQNNKKYNIVNLFQNRDQKIHIDLPLLKCPFGITKFTNNIEKYSLNININTNSELFNYFNNIDDWIVDNFINNKKWLDVLNIDYNSKKSKIIKLLNKTISQTKNFSPYLNIKLIYDNNKHFFSDIFLNKNNIEKKINTIDEIHELLYNKNLYVSGSLILSNVYIQNNKFGVTLKPRVLYFQEK
jgi:hypothetical protein